VCNIKVYGGEGRGTGPEFVAPSVFNLGIKYRRVISLTFPPYYPRGKSTLYSLNRILSVSQSWFGPIREEQNSWAAETQTLDRLILVTTPIALSRINNTDTLSTHLVYFNLLSNSGNTEACFKWLLWMMACAKDRKERCPIFCGQELRKRAKFVTTVQCGDNYNYNYPSQKYVFERKVRIRRGKTCVLLMGVPSDHRPRYGPGVA
jgi:hypothetical protein